MPSYQHSVSGFFVHRDCAETALAKLVQRGLRGNQLQITATHNHSPAKPTFISRGNQINFMIYAVMGASIGFALGLLLEFVLLVSDSPMRLFSITSPTMLIVWCILAGGFLGTAVGCTALWRDSPKDDLDDVMLVAKTHSEGETAIAREVLRASADLYRDTDMRGKTRA